MLSFTELVTVCATLAVVTLMVCVIVVLKYAHRLVTGEWADE